MAVRARPVEELPAGGDRVRPAAERVRTLVDLRRQDPCAHHGQAKQTVGSHLPDQNRRRALICTTRAPLVLVNRPKVGLFSEVESPVKFV